MYLYLAALGLPCCSGFSCRERGLLIAVACCGMQAPRHEGFNSCSSQTLEHGLNSFDTQA